MDGLLPVLLASADGDQGSYTFISVILLSRSLETRRSSDELGSLRRCVVEWRSFEWGKKFFSKEE